MNHIRNPISSNNKLIDLKIVTACLVWYSVSSLTTQLTKRILNQFDFPVFVGEFQFLFNVLLGYLMTFLILKFPRYRVYFPNDTLPVCPLKFNKHFFKLYFPMGTFQFVGKLFSLAATSVCSVATVASIRALGPLLIVLGYRFYYKLTFPIHTYLSLIPLLLGVLIIVLSQSKESASLYSEVNNINSDFENNNNHGWRNLVSILVEEGHFLRGIVYALLSATIFAAGSIYAKNVVTKIIPEDKEKIDFASLALSNDEKCNPLDTEPNDIEKGISINRTISEYTKLIDCPDKLTTLMYCSLFGLVYSIPTFFSYEFFDLVFGVKVISNNSEIENYHFIPWKLLLLNGISYFLQSIIAFHILALLPTVSYSIAAMMKRIVIITVSMFLTGKKLTFLEFLGLFHIAIGLYSYDRWGSKRN